MHSCCYKMLFSGMIDDISCSCSTGQFKLTMEFTEQYPNEPPKVKFLSALYHPNGKTPTAPCLRCYHLDLVFM